MKLETKLTCGATHSKTVMVLPGMEITYRAVSEDTGGAFSVFEINCDAGVGPPVHIHSLEDESFYVLEGTFEFCIGDQTLTATPGWFGIGPRGLPHCFHAAGGQPAKLLMIATPGGFESFFDELAALTADPSTESSQIAAAFASHGMQLVD